MLPSLLFPLWTCPTCPQPAAVFTGLPGHFHQPRVAASRGPEWPSGPLRPTFCQGDTSAPLASSPSSYLCPGGPGPLPHPALLPRNGRRKADHFPPSWEPPAPSSLLALVRQTGNKLQRKMASKPELLYWKQNPGKSVSLNPPFWVSLYKCRSFPWGQLGDLGG